MVIAKKKKKTQPSHYLPLPNHKTTIITITKPRSVRRKKTITKPRSVRRRKAITKPRSVRRKKKDREAKTHTNLPLPIKPPSKTHTHTHKPTTSNLHKSKPIMPIYYTMTHYNPYLQPTIPLPPNSTYTPQPVDR